MFPIDLIVERAIGNHVDFSIVATALLREGLVGSWFRELRFLSAVCWCNFFSRGG